MTTFRAVQIEFEIDLRCQAVHLGDEAHAFFGSEWDTAVVNHTTSEQHLHCLIQGKIDDGFLIGAVWQAKANRWPVSIRLPRVNRFALWTRFDKNIFREKVDVHGALAGRTRKDCGKT